jgi:hypothetical protein
LCNHTAIGVAPTFGMLTSAVINALIARQAGYHGVYQRWRRPLRVRGMR